METFLKNKHAEDYLGLDDDMPDAYDEWLTELEIDEWIELSEEYANK